MWFYTCPNTTPNFEILEIISLCYIQTYKLIISKISNLDNDYYSVVLNWNIVKLRIWGGAEFFISIVHLPKLLVSLVNRVYIGIN